VGGLQRRLAESFRSSLSTNPVAPPAGSCILLAEDQQLRMTDNDITAILQQWAAGDASALDQLMPLVYNDLRRLARSRLRNEGPDCTLQPTALVHEAFLRLTGQREPDMQTRGQFFHLAAKLMRRILIDHAKRRKAVKRGGDKEDLVLDEALASTPEKFEEWLAVDEALDQFASIDPFRARIVELRYFAGFSVEEVAELMRISATTARRDWAVARCWLQRRLEDSKHGSATLEFGQ
jgi:RNA polymerase sigma-70 factor (ECF subfamily)